MTFICLPHIPDFMYKYIYLKHICLGAVVFFMLMTVSMFHYKLTVPDYCESNKIGLFFYNVVDFLGMVLHVVSFILSIFMIPGIVLDVPPFVTAFMVAYLWWVLLLFLGNTLRVWACLCGGAKVLGLLLHLAGYLLPAIYFVGASYMNTFADMIEA